MRTATIFDIKRFAIHDGPGIRMTIFFKGCPLSCAWCHNPESQSGKVQKLWSAKKCIGALDCVTACPEGALSLTPGGLVTDMDLCDLCGKCAAACPAKAIEMSGREETVDSLMARIGRERVFFDQSGGGITCSGGEPLMQYKFLIELLEACGSQGIHRAVDTSGFVHPDVLLEVVRHTDLFLYDIKLIDPERHERWTGVRNERILSNLHRLAQTGVPIQLRMPLIRGVNTDAENIRQTARFIASLPGEQRSIRLLPYHETGKGKREKLGMPALRPGMERPDGVDLKQVAGIFSENGIEVVVE